MKNLTNYGINLKYISLLILLTLNLFTLNADDKVEKKPVIPIKPIIFKGKPIFPIGVFDLASSKSKTKTRLLKLDNNLYDCGVNSAFFGTLGMPNDPNYPGYTHIIKGLEKNSKDPRFKQLALIVQLGHSTYSKVDKTPSATKSRRKFRPLTNAEIIENKKFLQEAFKKFSEYDNIIGYSYDEPENTFNNYYQRTKGKDNLDAGLAKALIQYLGWLKPFIQKHHPNALQIPIIGWWGSYNYTAPLYDIIIANQYTKTKDKKEFSSPLYQISFDAARMVSAARANNKSAIYMPTTFNHLKGDWTVPTLAEQRYLFFAPITRGAMGIMGWRLNRCTQEYREKVIYVALKELSKYKEFYLGTWLDHYVSSDKDDASVKYLKRFSTRSKLMIGEKDGRIVEVTDFVPDISYCLRKHKDGRMLLIVVNNLKEATTATIKLSIPNFKGKITEEFSKRVISLCKNQSFKAKFNPFGVHIYMISEVK